MNLSLTDEQKGLRVRSFPIADENEETFGQEKTGRNQLVPGHLNPNGKLAGNR